ncbi:DUF3467 domain-containing protein [Bacillus sp. FSL R9-9410]|uniref:DUF3467 domain-containing protein n=1 Tax=Bacillus sp. FSL R9-9410 TaxID=2921590 RepID=UPI003100B79E
MTKNVVEVEVAEVVEKLDTESQSKPRVFEYSNSVSVNTNIYNFTLTFEQSNPTGDIEISTLMMSPEHTKAFSKVLVECVEEYEQKHGTIPTKSQQ